MARLLLSHGIVALAFAGGRADNIAPEDHVNVFGGTANTYDFSRGNVLPETVMPWGFNGFAPETGGVEGTANDPFSVVDQPGGFWFYSKAYRMFGMRLTHQPSPWTGDYGPMRFMAHIMDPEHTSDNQFVAYDPRKSTWKPYYQNHTLLGYCSGTSCMTFELTPTEHGAIMRFKFPSVPRDAKLSDGWNQTRRILAVMNPMQNNAAGEKPNTPSWKNDSVSVGKSGSDHLSVMTGFTTRCDSCRWWNPGEQESKNFTHYFYMTVAAGTSGTVPVTPAGTSTKKGVGSFDFKAEDVTDDTLIVRIATSLISQEQAKANHADEVKGKDFDSVRDAAKSAWNGVLSRMDIVDVGPGYSAQQERDWKEIFYTSMYRASKYPRKLWETNFTTGKAVHYSPYSGKIEDGPLSSDQGFWDAYRTTYSWLALVLPERATEMMSGWLSAFDESAWIPQWAHPGAAGGMTGTMSDVVLSEAIIKYPHCPGTSPISDTHGLDVPAARKKGYCVNASGLYAGALKNAMTVPTNTSNGQGRVCLDEYRQLGFIPTGCSDAQVSRSMNYWHSDWAISQAATVLGKTNDAKELLAQSAKWKLLLDPETNHFRTKHPNGSFTDSFDEFAWGPMPGYTEAGPWQYRFEVPFDPKALAAAFRHNGESDPCDLVQQANTMSSAYHFGGYPTEIHEMTEMAINCWGQWELNNQPVWALQHMQVGFDTSPTGKCANQAQKWLRQSNSMLSPGPEMYPGDEDNGSMGAWFIFNMLGFYSLSPASGKYVLGSPLFANVTLNVGADQLLQVIAKNQGIENIYVQSVVWNEKPVTDIEIDYTTLMQGGVLQFTMGSKPVESSQ